MASSYGTVFAAIGGIGWVLLGHDPTFDLHFIFPMWYTKKLMCKSGEV